MPIRTLSPLPLTLAAALLFSLACIGFKDDEADDTSIEGDADADADADSDTDADADADSDTDSDADADSDADSDADTDSDADADADMVTGSIEPCFDGVNQTSVVDSYFVVVGSGGATLSADTVNAATAFDLALADMDELLTLGDDEVDCTYPPPDYSCPQAALVGPAIYEIGVYGASANCTNFDLGLYIFSVSGDGFIDGVGNYTDDPF